MDIADASDNVSMDSRHEVSTPRQVVIKASWNLETGYKRESLHLQRRKSENNLDVVLMEFLPQVFYLPLDL